MTELQAAIGRVQLKKLPTWLERRRKNAQAATRALEGAKAIRTSTPPQHVEHAYYRYHFHLDPTHLQEGWDRDSILGLLQERGEFAHMGTCSEIYREQAFRVRGWGPKERLPVASRLQETSLTVPVHHRLEPEQVEAIARGVRGLLRRFPRSRAPTRS